MKIMKSAELNAPSMIKQSRMPSMEMAGKIEYL